MSYIDATNFSFKEIYFKTDFEFILSKIYECYKLMIVKYDLIENNENKIRNRLYKDYLENNEIRDKLNIKEYLFDSETEIINDDYSIKGRTDIKVYNAIERTKDTNAYYIIECKRLDGKSTLNKKYINQGINRFINQKYPLYKSVNGMIGFIVNDINISENSKLLNLSEFFFIPDFSYSFISTHEVQKTKEEFTLYHLMLDFNNKLN